jgi:hypothetical protein
VTVAWQTRIILNATFFAEKTNLHRKNFAMKPRPRSPRPRRAERAGYGGKTNIKRTCPLCAEQVIRIHRRPIDYLLSLFAPVHRFRCPEISCQWEGNLPVRRLIGARTERRQSRNARSAAT